MDPLAGAGKYVAHDAAERSGLGSGLAAVEQDAKSASSVAVSVRVRAGGGGGVIRRGVIGRGVVGSRALATESTFAWRRPWISKPMVRG